MVLNDLCHRVNVQCAACASPGKVLCPDPPWSPERCWPCSSSLRLKAGEEGVTADVAMEGLRQPGRGGWGSLSPSSAIRQCTGKGGPSLPKWLRGSLHCHFLSQDDVNNVTFLQHLSECMSENTKPGKELPSSSSSSLLSSPQSRALMVHWTQVLVPYPFLLNGRGQGQGGGAQEDTDAGLDCFSLDWHRVLLETGASSAGQPSRALVHKASKGFLHLLGRLLWGSHSGAFLQPAAEILVYLDSRVRRGTWRWHGENRYMPWVPVTLPWPCASP